MCKNIIGNLNIIFSEKIVNEELNKIQSGIFDNKDIYNDNNGQEKEFNKHFNLIINSIYKITKDFIVMVEFAKGNNNIDYNSLGSSDSNFENAFYKIDIFEGNLDNNKVLNGIRDSIKKSKVYDKEKLISSGTDAHKMKDIKKNIKRIPWYLSTNDFEGILNVVNHPSRRSFYNENIPFLTEDYITKVSIGNEEITLNPGLNTIIGRRGSGKSWLINDIYESFDDTKNIDNAKNIFVETNTINLIGKEDVLYLKQDELASNITKNIDEISKFKIEDFDIFKLEFKKDRTGFDECIHIFDITIEKFKKNLKKLLNLKLQIRKNDISSNFNSLLHGVYNKSISFLNSFLNEKEALMLEEEIKLTKKWEEEAKSDWLKSRIIDIKSQMENLQKKDKYNLTLITNLISEYKFFLSKKEQNDSKVKEEEELSNVNNFLKNSNLISDFNNLKEFIEKIKQIHLRIKNKEYFYIENEKLNNNSVITYDVKIASFTDNQYEDINKFIEYFVKVGNSIENSKKKITRKERFMSLDSFKSIFKTDLIIKISGESIQGKSMGQKHQLFLEHFLKLKDYKIILLDQPDDDLDSITVHELIIKMIIEYSNEKQWIVVTHDPKIVINCDSRSIILANYEKSSEESINATYQNMTAENIRNFGFKILDATKDFPISRTKIYQ